jgi:hypothetical protein
MGPGKSGPSYILRGRIEAITDSVLKVGDTAFAVVIQNAKAYQPHWCYRRSFRRGEKVAEWTKASLYSDRKCAVCCGKNTSTFKSTAYSYFTTQIPYLAIESSACLEFRKRQKEDRHPHPGNIFADQHFRTYWELADDYGPRSQIKGQRDTVHIAQTLDQYHLAINHSLFDQATDQVMYRYTAAHDKTKSKLLMVNQLWMWSVESMQSINGRSIL